MTVVTLLAPSAGSAAAIGEGSAEIVEDGVDIGVIDPGGSPGSPGPDEAAPIISCTTSLYLPDDNVVGGLRWDPIRQTVTPAYGVGTRYFSSTGRWLVQRCVSKETGHLVSHRIFPEGQAVDPAELMRTAEDRLDPPDPAIFTAPPARSDLIVQTPTWLWLDPGYWHSYSETASTGRVSATATATPVSVAWEMGNGETIECGGPGTPWSSGVAVPSGACTYTYRHSSAGAPGDSFDLSATVTFDVVWSSVNAGGAGGYLGQLTRSASLPVKVGEIQALVVAD